jgi:hypothetical protein
MSKLIATYLDRPHLVVALAWGQWIINVLAQWAASGQVLTWQTLVSTAVAAWFTRRPGDATAPQVAARVQEARLSAASAGYEEGVRNSRPPLAWEEVPELELPDELTPRERPSGGGMQ